jgi:hypothetical protein
VAIVASGFAGWWKGGRAEKTFPRKSLHTEISPLRYASVEMTKGRAALPERVVAEQRERRFSGPLREML